MSEQLRVIKDAFGVDLRSLPLETDDSCIDAFRNDIASLPEKPLRLLLLSNSAQKFHEKWVLTFFNAVATERCDCVLFDDGRSFRPSLPNLNYLESLEHAGRTHRRTPYDRIVSFDSNERLLEACSALAAPGVHIGRVRHNIDAPPRWRRAAGYLLPRRVREGRPVRVYNTQAHCQTIRDFRIAFDHRRVDMRSEIDFPPHVDVAHKVPSTPIFPTLVIGGGNRHYGFLRRCAAALDGPVVVAGARPGDWTDYGQNRHLENLQRDPKFVLVSWLLEDLYLKLLLHSRVVVVPLRGWSRMAYTAVSDAIWYGKPVITTRVRANAHLADRVTLVSNPEDVRDEIRRLRDDNYYRDVCERTRERARSKNSLHELLCTLYREL